MRSPASPAESVPTNQLRAQHAAEYDTAFHAPVQRRRFAAPRIPLYMAMDADAGRSPVCRSLRSAGCLLSAPWFGHRLNSERLLRRRWFATLLLVQLVAQDGGMPIHFFSRAHDFPQRTMCFPDAPRHDRSLVRCFQIGWLRDVLCGNRDARHRYERRELLLPHDRGVLHWHSRWVGA